MDAARSNVEQGRGVIDRYREFLPVSDSTPVISLGEGNTPQMWLARNEGIFVEPASAASVAGFFKCCESKDAARSFRKIAESSRIVCTVTGNGLKDPDMLKSKIDDFRPIEAKIDNILRAIGF